MATLQEIREKYYSDSILDDDQLAAKIYTREFLDKGNKTSFFEFADKLGLDSGTKAKAFYSVYEERMQPEGIDLKQLVGRFPAEDREFTGNILWTKYTKDNQGRESRIPLGLYADELGLSAEQFSTLLEKAEKEGVNITAMGKAEEEAEQSGGRPDLPYSQRPQLRTDDVDRTPIRQRVTSLLRSFQDRLLGGFGADAQAFIQTGLDRLLDTDRATDDSILEAINQLGQEGQQFSGNDIRQRAVEITSDKTFAEESEERRREYLQDIKEYREDIGFVDNVIQELAFNPLARLGAGKDKLKQLGGAVVYGAAQGLGQSEEDRLKNAGTTAGITAVLTAGLPLFTKPLSVAMESITRSALFRRVASNIKEIVNNDPNITEKQLRSYLYGWLDDVKEQAGGVKLNKGVVDALSKELDALWAGRTPAKKEAVQQLEKIRPKKTNVSVLEDELNSVVNNNKLATRTATKQELGIPLTAGEIEGAKAKIRYITNSLEKEAAEFGFTKKEVRDAVAKLNETGDFSFAPHISGKDIALIKKKLFRQSFQNELNLGDIIKLRQNLPEFKTAQSDVAKQSIDAIDNWLDNLTPEQITGQFLRKTIREYRAVNKAYARLSRSNTVLNAISESKGDALALKSRLQQLLKDAKLHGFTKQEITAIQDLSKMSPLGLSVMSFGAAIKEGSSKVWSLLQATSILTKGGMRISPLNIGGVLTGLGYGVGGLIKYIGNLVTNAGMTQRANMYARLMRSGQIENFRAFIPDTVATLENAWRMSRPAVVQAQNEMEAQENVQGMLGL